MRGRSRGKSDALRIWIGCALPIQASSPECLSAVAAVTPQVTVKSSASNKADFDGDLYLSLGGTYSGADEIKLTSGDAAGDVYVSGGDTTFSIKAPDMGTFTTASVRIECPRKAKSFALESITVADTTSGAAPTTFYLRDELKMPDKATASLLPAATCNYRATVRTGSGAGAEGAKLYISLVGTDGMDSGDVALDLSAAAGSDAAPLSAGSVCTASFSALEFGTLTGIKLRLVSGAIASLTGGDAAS